MAGLNKPVDTRSWTPEERLLAAATLGTTEFVEAIERRGGEEMVVADVVPTQGSEQLAELGITLGEVCEDDPIFRAATLPDGWSREPGDNPAGYWTYIVDEQRRRRVAMFYKASWYDRRASCHLVRE